MRRRLPPTALAKLGRQARVSCESRGIDKYERMLGICFVDGRDINAEMVREGLAWAFVKYSQTLREARRPQARAARVGIWQGEAAAGRGSYREKRWAGAEQQAPQGCAIKGNVTAHGRIYHMPWSPWYGRSRSRRRRASAGSAAKPRPLAAGWRPVAAH